MKKYKIRPLSILRGVWLFIWVFFIVISLGTLIFVLTEANFNLFHCIGLFFSLIGLTIGLIVIILEINKGIEFEDNGMKVKADNADKGGLLIRKIQYNTDIVYSEIKNISITASNKDSLGQTVKHVFVKMPYIVFKCKDGTEKAVNVYYFNKKQKIAIIDEVICRAKNKGNDLEIESGEKLWDKFYSEKTKFN